MYANCISGGLGGLERIRYRQGDVLAVVANHVVFEGWPPLLSNACEIPVQESSGRSCRYFRDGKSLVHPASFRPQPYPTSPLGHWQSSPRPELRKAFQESGSRTCTSAAPVTFSGPSTRGVSMPIGDHVDAVGVGTVIGINRPALGCHGHVERMRKAALGQFDFECVLALRLGIAQSHLCSFAEVGLVCGLTDQRRFGLG